MQKFESIFFSWKQWDVSDCYHQMNGGISTIGKNFYISKYLLHILLSRLVAKILYSIWCGEYPESDVSSTEKFSWAKAK